MNWSILDTPFQLFFCVCLVYLAVTRFYYLLAGAHNLWQRLEESWRQESQDMEMVLHSRFTIPVSLVVYNVQDTAALAHTLDALLAQNYPEFEIIVIADRDHDRMLEDPCMRKYGLQPHTYFFSRVLPTRQVRALYRSSLYSMVIMALKETDNELDALHAGINLARYRYVLPVQAGTWMQPDALLKLIRPALRNPREVVAVAAPIGVQVTPLTPANKSWRGWWRHFWGLWQQTEQLRHSLIHRHSLQQRRLFVGGLGGVWGDDELVLWRKDLLLALGGFLSGGALEFSLRVQEYCHKQALPCVLHGTSETVAWRAADDNVKKFAQRRAHAWQRLNATLTRHRGALLQWDKAGDWRREHGTRGWLAILMLLLETRFGAWLEIAVFTLIPLGILTGALPGITFVLLLLLLAGPSLLLTLLAAFPYLRQTPALAWRDFGLLLLACFADYLGLQQFSRFLQSQELKRGGSATLQA